MAFNIQTFKTRTLTAIVFAVVMLSGLFINHWSFFILFSIIHFGCWIEYQKLIGLIDPTYKQIKSSHKYGIILLGWCFMMYMSNSQYKLQQSELRGIGWLFMIIISIILLATEIVIKKDIAIKPIAYSLIGLIYISLSWGMMINLRGGFETTALKFSIDYGVIIPAGLIFSIWINDTMAYIVGSVFGKTPLSAISPKKTWEGTIGGAILCIIAIAWLSKIVPVASYYSMSTWVVIAAIAAVIGTIGDLIESKLKRMANVKDSGNFMPGHGGFLDRFDSLLLATPFVWLYVHLLLNN